METFFKINDMTLADTEGCADLEQKIFARSWSKESIEDTLSVKENVCLVAVDGNGVIAGYCIFTTSFEDADLCRIAVSAEYRRKHIAEKLFESAFKKLEKNGINRILLEVRKSNEPAVSLYKKYGFKEVGIRKGYYSEPVEDALVFLLEIIPAITTVH